MDREHVAIVGAGIAGLFLAARLTRAGIPCRVYEQAPALGEVGAGVQLAPNAVRLLARLGLADRLRAVAVRPEAVRMHRWDDVRLLAATELGVACETRYGAPYYTVHRADLHAALVSAVPADVIVCDARCTSIVDSPQSAILTFVNGWSVEADLVVGADGIRSVVRQSLETDQPRFSGQSIYRGLVDARSVPHLVADPAVRLWLGPGQHVVCYPVSGGRLVNVGATVPSEDWRDKDWQVESWSAPGDHAALVAAYQGWHAEVRRLIDALDPERLRRWALHDRDDVGRWHGHRTVLVGDAAHPMLPFLAQGANQAIEDAAVLAGCLTTGDLTFGNVSFDNVSSALARYEELRRPRAAEVQRLSRRNTTRLHTTEHLTEEHQTEELARSQRLAEQDWLYGYDADEVLGAAHSR